MTGSLALGAIVAAAAWLVLVLGLTLPVVPKRWRADCFWVSVMAAVPLLGWLTYAWGPGLGVLGFIAGVLALRRCCRIPDRVPDRVPDRTPSLPPAE